MCVCVCVPFVCVCVARCVKSRASIESGRISLVPIDPSMSGVYLAKQTIPMQTRSHWWRLYCHYAIVPLTGWTELAQRLGLTQQTLCASQAGTNSGSAYTSQLTEIHLSPWPPYMRLQRDKAHKPQTDTVHRRISILGMCLWWRINIVMGLGFGNDCVSGSQGDDDVYNPLGGIWRTCIRYTSIASVMIPQFACNQRTTKV